MNNFSELDRVRSSLRDYNAGVATAGQTEKNEPGHV